MNIFLSYGHDQNEVLVQRIKADLEAAGHRVWIDADKIRVGDDWRRSIVQGLTESDWTVAILSKHSTRDPGVCLDELAIALNVKGATIATVLVEAEDMVGAPVTIGHIQWLDMHDWRKRRADDPAAFETWYAEKLKELRDLLASDRAQRFAGEIEALRRWLKPISQDADIAPLVEGFVGREWLHEKLEAWRTKQSASRLFWLTGAPGSGKSAFAAHTAHFGRSNVIGLNLCRYILSDRSDPRRVLRTLAFQAATRLHDYRALLLDRLKIDDPKETEIENKTAAELFDWLLVQRLRAGIDGDRRSDRFLIVIDGLDETIRDGRSELAEVLAEGASRLPEWVGLLVTSRRDPAVVRPFAGLQQQWIDPDSLQNKDDLQRYVQGWRGQSVTAEESALQERILAACSGSFQYLRQLRAGVEAGLLDLNAQEGLPKGLAALYLSWFQRQFPDEAAYERDMVPLLEVLVAAEHPVPEDVLTGLFGWGVREQARRLEQLGSLFERRPEGWAPFHKSLRDWLTDETTTPAVYLVDSAAGRAKLFKHLWTQFCDAAVRDEVGTVNSFALIELPRLIAGQQERALAESMAGADWVVVWQCAEAVSTDCQARYEWDRMLAWSQAGVRIAASQGEAGLEQQALSRFRVAISHTTRGNGRAAIEAYEAVRDSYERLLRQDPGNTAWQGSLALAQNNLGLLLSARGDATAARAAYEAARDSYERLLRQDPGNTAWQRGLALVQGNLGLLLSAVNGGSKR